MSNPNRTEFVNSFSWSAACPVCGQEHGYTDELPVPGERIICPCGQTLVVGLQDASEDMGNYFLEIDGVSHYHVALSDKNFRSDHYTCVCGFTTTSEVEFRRHTGTPADRGILISGSL
jgi:hypothetical protein